MATKHPSGSNTNRSATGFRPTFVGPLRVKFASYLMALAALLAALVACGADETPTEQLVAATATPQQIAAEQATEVSPTAAPRLATAAVAPTDNPGPAPTEAPATATSPPPTATPTETPPTEEPRLPTVGVTAGHPAALLTLLPESTLYVYINLETVSQRPELMEDVEFQLAHFVSTDELPFAEELLVSVGVKALMLSSPFLSYEWAIVLLGDFTHLADALKMASQSGAGLAVSVAETHQGTDIYTLTQTGSSGYQSEIYLAVLDQETLTASPDLVAVQDVLNRYGDGGELPETLVAMVEEWGLSDYFLVTPLAGLGDAMEGPMGAARFFAYHATLGELSSTTLRGMWQFDNREQAATAVTWLQQQDEPHWRNIGWGASVLIDEWRLENSTVYGEATVPDEDMPALVQGN